MTQPSHVVLLSIPGLRGGDLDRMPRLRALMQGGGSATLTPSFPAVTWPAQANMLTGCLPREHGVVANGFFWRDTAEVEMWTAWNDKIQRPQIWDLLHQRDPQLTSAVWFPMLSKGCGADYICMPAPIHNPDGSESLWCYTKPVALYGELRDALGHFPLKHFWGPLANIQSTAWIVDSAIHAAARFRPRFFYLYLPHLDYAAQKSGPDSPAAAAAVGELDEVVGRLADSLQESLGDPLFLAASEYTISPVRHVSYPNRLLRDAGLLRLTPDEQGGQQLDVAASDAWALVDHQFSHVFVRNRDSAAIARAAAALESAEGVAEVLAGDQRSKYALDHERSGDLIVISEPHSWQAYYWWRDDAEAPSYARTVDIHRKPGYDPVELHFDPVQRCIPLDAALIGGSHGAPAEAASQQGVLLSSRDVLGAERLRDTDVAGLVLRQFD